MTSSERGHLDATLRRDLTLNLRWGECKTTNERKGYCYARGCER
jgi:hypothetical protein